MDLNKHIVDQRIRKIIDEYPIWFEKDNDINKKISKALIILGVSTYLGLDLDEVFSFVTEGGNDAGVDALYIGDTTDYEFQVTIFQGKYKLDLEKDSNFPANAVLRVVKAIESIFDPQKDMSLNEELRPKVEEIRSLISDGFIPSVQCVLINNGSRWNTEGDQHVTNANFPSNQVIFEHFNHNNMVEILKGKKKIDDTIALIGKGIVEEFNFKRVLLGKILVTEISSLMDRHGDFLLEKNIRKYLGLRRNRVNENIKDTLLSNNKTNFYFFNNGITMVCDQFKHNALSSENWHVTIKNMQIINGGQTCKTIQQTINENISMDFSNAFVLLRLYEVGEEDSNLLTDITLATNSQNPVDLRDLRSNEELQRNLEYAVKQLGYIYKTKREITSSGDIIPSSVAAESVHAIWRKKPHVTKFRRNELFGKFYNDIFKNLNSAQLIIAVLIFRYCDSQRKKHVLSRQYIHLPYSNYFLSMIMGDELLRKANLQLKELNHLNFNYIKEFFETHKEELYEKANEKLITALNNLYTEGYENVELRRLASTFRRGDLIDEL
jgi:hypothetical protein